MQQGRWHQSAVTRREPKIVAAGFDQHAQPPIGISRFRVSSQGGEKTGIATFRPTVVVVEKTHQIARRNLEPCVAGGGRSRP